MASRHLKQDRTTALSPLVVVMTFVVPALVGIISALAVHVIDGMPTAARESAPAPAAQQPVSQEGKLVAVSATSVTALSVDGFARTYVIDSQTNAITSSGSSVGGAGSTFAVNDEVAIVGVVRDGVAVATAVADQQVTNLNGPPMDAAESTDLGPPLT